jgi:TIR domain
MAFVFISYAREDQTLVDRLSRSLKEAQIQVWLDRDSIAPGDDWSDSLKSAITKGSYFIACFSASYYNRPNRYMAEELSLATSILSKDRDHSWFLPIRFEDVEVPDISMRDGVSIRSIQWLDLFNDWDEGIHRLVTTINPLWMRDFVQIVRKRIISDGCKLHINNKIKHFHQLNTHRFKEIEDRWKDSVEGTYSDQLYNIILSSFDTAAANNQPATERFIEPSDSGKMILVTAVPHFNNPSLIQWLTQQTKCEIQTYYSFAIQQKRQLRTFPRWEKRDLVHWIFRQEGPESEMECDLLYICNFELMLEVSAYRHWLISNQKIDMLMPLEQIYPTTLMTAIDCETMIAKVLMEDAQSNKMK